MSIFYRLELFFEGWEKFFTVLIAWLDYMEDRRFGFWNWYPFWSELTPYTQIDPANEFKNTFPDHPDAMPKIMLEEA